MRMARPAFSMVELIVVLVLLGLMAATITLRLHSPLYLARINDFKESMAAYDRLTRRICLEQDRPVRLWVDLSEGRIERRSADGGNELGTALQLPHGLKLIALRVGRDEIVAGRYVIPFSRRGLCTTYGLCIEAREGDRHWLVISGLTGQTLEPEEDLDVREMFLADPATPGGFNPR